MTVGETLDLRVGSVVALERLSGETADLLVNGSAIACGEVVVIDEQYGLRITEILDGQRDPELETTAPLVPDGAPGAAERAEGESAAGQSAAGGGAVGQGAAGQGAAGGGAAGQGAAAERAGGEATAGERVAGAGSPGAGSPETPVAGADGSDDG